MNISALLGWLLALIAAVVPQGPWTQTLADLDERRNDAFVREDPSALAQVYEPGSEVLAADRAVLRGYRRRGLEIDRVSMQVIKVEVLDRRDGEVHLRVVDRLLPVRVRAAGGPWQTLPQDRATERMLTLRRVEGRWRIAAAERLAG